MSIAVESTTPEWRAQFHISATGDVIHTQDGLTYRLPINPATRAVADAITEDVQDRPRWWDVVEGYTEHVVLLRQVQARMVEGRQQAEREMRRYKDTVRTALVEGYAEHKRHITLADANELLEALGLKPMPRLVKGTVRLVATYSVEVTELEVEAHEDVEEKMIEQALENTSLPHGWDWSGEDHTVDDIEDDE